MDPQVTCDLETYDNMRHRIRALEATQAKLQAQLDKRAMFGDAPRLPWWRRSSSLTEGKQPVQSVAERMRDAVRLALPIVQFAQANLDPEFTRGWPHEKLRQLAQAVLAMPGVDQNEIDWAGDAAKYAEGGRILEELRKQGRQKELEQVPRSGIATGEYAQKAMEILERGKGGGKAEAVMAILAQAAEAAEPVAPAAEATVTPPEEKPAAPQT